MQWSNKGTRHCSQNRFNKSSQNIKPLFITNALHRPAGHLLLTQMDFETYNAGVKQWATDMRQSMVATGQQMGIQHRGNSTSPSASLSQIKNRFKMDAGAIEVISFQFPRALIFVHKGAGKGRAGTVGSSWLDRYGQRQKTASKSMGKMGTGGRTAKPWFSTPVDAGIDRLADLAAEHLGASITQNILK